MRLLVSVRGPVEARAALAGGADVIDAKDPARGALGAVSAERLAAIRRTVGAARPVSAALGDAHDAVAAWVAAVRAAGLFAALAGRLSGADFATARAVGAELVGVRGAACVGGRKGRVSEARVAALQGLVRAPPPPTLSLGVLA